MVCVSVVKMVQLCTDVSGSDRVFGEAPCGTFVS